jgi:1-acyl-sn-glycerol-3-phosphate acyltransferase
VPYVFRAVNTLVRLGIALLRIRVEIEGAENLPRTPGVIVASNHLSIADPLLISGAVQRLAARRVRYMAKAEALGWPVLGRLLTAYGGFGVRRGQADREAYRLALSVLGSGDWLGLAPEGTRSRTGALAEPKPGAILLAQRAGSTIVPVGIAGSERVWPVGAKLPRPFSRVTLRFGKPITPEELAAAAGSDRRAATEAASELLMRRIAELLPPAYRGRFG